MHCKICDKDSESVTLDNDCSECQEVIYDCLLGYEEDEELLDADEDPA